MPKICMLDWETLDTEPTAKVISVGAVIFELGKPEEQVEVFHSHISALSQQSRSESPATIQWWQNQPEEAKAQSFNKRNDPHIPEISSVIMDLNNFITVNHAEYIMGNGNMFDCAIYRNICTELGIAYPVSFWQDLDFRTAQLVMKGIKPLWPSDYTKHYALDDARYQVICLQKWWAELYG